MSNYNYMTGGRTKYIYNAFKTMKQRFLHFRSYKLEIFHINYQLRTKCPPNSFTEYGQMSEGQTLTHIKAFIIENTNSLTFY